MQFSVEKNGVGQFLPASFRASLILIASLALGPRVFAGEVTGAITLKPGVTKRTISAAVYDLRGAATLVDSPRKNSSPFGHLAVWLEAKTPLTAAPMKAEMRQSGRRLQPDLLIVPVGSTVEFPNLDPIFHNIFSLSSLKPFDLGYYPQGKSRTIQFNAPGIEQVYCHIHSDMYGVVAVVPTGWYARPGDDGTFSFSDVSPGQYHVVVWQKASGFTKKKIEVPKAGNVRISMSVPETSED